MVGIERIDAAFCKSRKQQRAAFMPYFTLGYPDPETSLDVIEALARGGADLIELGVPFSDPLADGPVIQHSTQVALHRGMSVARCLDSVRMLRERGVETPLLLMGYFNPILAFGISRYAAEAARAGADGLIVPDLPPEEAGEVCQACQENGLAMVCLLAPTSTPERIALGAASSTGFVYLVSVRGVTGKRDTLPLDLTDFVSRVRAVTGLPLAIGFGISTPEQAAVVGRLADGVIVGSALIQAISQGSNPVRDAEEFTRQVANSLRQNTGISSRV